MDDPAKRDSAGRFGEGNRANPSGRPKAFKEYQEWLRENALDPAKEALLACLKSDDQKVQMLAVKEVHDRLFGKAPQAITNEDGSPLLGGISADVIEHMRKLTEGK
jgi:hypothetical protein